jgi:hypothetical protein
MLDSSTVLILAVCFGFLLGWMVKTELNNVLGKKKRISN